MAVLVRARNKRLLQKKVTGTAASCGAILLEAHMQLPPLPWTSPSALLKKPRALLSSVCIKNTTCEKSLGFCLGSMPVLNCKDLGMKENADKSRVCFCVLRITWYLSWEPLYSLPKKDQRYGLYLLVCSAICFCPSLKLGCFPAAGHSASAPSMAPGHIPLPSTFSG